MLARLLLAAAGGGGSFAAPAGPIVAQGARVDIATGSGYKAFPGMALDEINFAHRLHLVYRDGSAHNSSGGVSKYQYSDDFGATWSAAVTLFSPTAGDDIRDNYISVLPSGRLLLMLDYRTPWNGATIFTLVTWSDDGGATWNDAAINTMYTLPRNVGDNEDDASGHVWVLPDDSLFCPGYADVGGLYRAIWWNSTDDGETWADATVIASSGTGSFNETTVRRLASGLYVALMRDETSGHTFRSTASDPSGTWSEEADVLAGHSRPDWLEYRSGRSIWFGRNNNTDFFGRWSTSEDGGTTWAALQNVDGASDLWMYGAPVLLDPGRVGIAYSIENSSGDADLFYRLYSDTGA